MSLAQLEQMMFNHQEKYNPYLPLLESNKKIEPLPPMHNVDT